MKTDVEEARAWPDKYSPKTWDEFVGNPTVLAKVKRWAEEWQRDKYQKPLLFYGPPGTGKTALAHLVAYAQQWQLFEMNASDFRTRDVVERLAGAASQAGSFLASRRLILIDEVDGLQAEDKGGAQAIAKVLKESANPVILTANDVYADRKLTQLRQLCELVQFKRINYLSIASRLKQVCRKEGIQYEEAAIKELAKGASGDLRAALLDLQSLAYLGKITLENVRALSMREREQNIFSVVRGIFAADTIAKVQKKRAACTDEFMLINWIEENLHQELQGRDLADAFNYLSRGDVFEGRIARRQYFGFRRYSLELMTSGIALSRTTQKKSWPKYSFPQWLKKMSASKQAREMRKAIALKIGKATHASSKRVLEADFNILVGMFKYDEAAVMLTRYFGLSESELAYMLELANSKADPAKLMERAFPEKVKVKKMKPEKKGKQAKLF
jgi:replication factor C large subunit